MICDELFQFNATIPSVFTTVEANSSIESKGDIVKQNNITNEMSTNVGGFQCEECYYIQRQYANRAQKVARYRVWLHGTFIKPL